MSVLYVFKTFYKFLLGIGYPGAKSRKGLFVLFVLLVVISNIAFNLNPYFYRLFVEGIPSLNQNYLINLLFLFMAIRVVGVIIDILAFIVGDLILFEGAKDARLNIFKHVSDLDFSFHTNKSTGSLISAFKRGDGAMFSFFHDIHVRFGQVIVGFLVMLYFLIQLNPIVVLLLGISLILTIIAAKFLVGNNVGKRKLFNAEEDTISGIITDNLINFETVKIFAKETWENNRLRKQFKPWTKALWGYGNSFRLIDGVMGTLITISIFLVLYLTLNQAVALEITIGEFVLITGFLSNFYPKLWDLVWSTRDLAKNYADIQKYFDLLDYKIEVLESENTVKKAHVQGSIEFNSVNHSYVGGTKNAIRDLSLTIRPGESVAFVGRSGSGKTTITKILMRFFDPERGTITIDGVDIKNFSKQSLRSFFGVVPQEAVLFNSTIAFNIGYGAKRAKSMDQIKKAARLANIADFIEKLPKGYQTNVGERGIKLSGGQKQRLAIARMIMSNPDIIIFDEATSHLDSESEKLIQDAFWNVAKGKTTIIIAHRLSTIAKADRIIVMERGKIVEMGTHRDLLQNGSGLYKHLWDLQLEK